jgi:NADP-dependent 3-hydroxy acid dehydrogenase YdfG
MRDLTGKVAWITGAGTGMGRAAALSLAEAGMKIALSGRRRDKLEDVAGEIGSDTLIEALDVTDQAAVAQIAGRISDKLGVVDILVNSAGLNTQKRFWRDQAIAEFDQVMAVNLNGAFYCCQAVLPAMRAQGDGLIINISSTAGVDNSTLSGPAYNASKAAMNWMSENLNIEDGENGIRSCAICPGETATEILDKRPVPVSREDRDKMLQADDIGDIVRFVATLAPHVCLRQVVVAPTWNRGYVGTVPKP